MNIIKPNKKQLDEFVAENGGNFQQSWNWTETFSRQGYKIKRLLVIEDDKPQGAACFVRYELPFGKHYWFCPKGPVISRQETADRRQQELLSKLLSADRGLQDAVFVRIEPKQKGIVDEGLPSIDLEKAPKDHSPKATRILDLTSDLDTLMKNMHKKTRYNIRLAGRRGVEVKQGAEHQEKFIELLKDTAGRDGFSIHPESHYRALLEDSDNKLFSAFYKGKYAAGAIVNFFGETTTYLHGASDYSLRKHMAPYLLHWKIIKYAKRKGMKKYDFWGVAPKGEKDHPWKGISRFKRNFGGEYVEYQGSFDVVLSNLWYSAYKIGRAIL